MNDKLNEHFLDELDTSLEEEKIEDFELVDEVSKQTLEETKEMKLVDESEEVKRDDEDKIEWEKVLMPISISTIPQLANISLVPTNSEGKMYTKEPLEVPPELSDVSYEKIPVLNVDEIIEMKFKV